MPAADLPRAAIADAGPVIHLDEIGQLAVLDGFAEVLVPGVVAGESERHRPGWRSRAPTCVRIEDPSPERMQAIRASAPDLDPGETAALALWQDRRDAVLLCDDLAARRHARSIGCEVAGTLGLLLWAAGKRRIELPVARELVAGLAERTTLHIDPRLLDEALAALDRRP